MQASYPILCLEVAEPRCVFWSYEPWSMATGTSLVGENKNSSGWITERIRQYDSSDTGHSDHVNIAAEHQEPAEVLSQLDNTSNSPVYGEYECC